jgi:hypothetical protein
MKSKQTTCASGGLESWGVLGNPSDAPSPTRRKPALTGDGDAAASIDNFILN